MQILWRCAIVVAAVFLFSSKVQAQDPDGYPGDILRASHCPANDLEVFDAFLEGLETCGTCEGTETYPLILGVRNKTGSTRTSFSFWAILETRDSEGELISREAISGCNGPIDGKGDHLLEFGDVEYTCGTNLTLTGVFMAYTDASGNDTRQCGPFNPETGTNDPVNPASISPKCGSSADIVIRTPVVAVAGPDVSITCITNANGAAIGEASTAGFTYVWSPTTGLSASNVSNPTANPSETTIYTVTKTRTSDGCSDTDQVTVTVDNAAVTAFAGDDFTKTCSSNQNGKQIGEASDAAFTYSWVPTTGLSASNISNPTANPTGTTTYTVTKTDISSGCSDTDVIEVDVDISPLGAPGGPDVDRCDAGSVELAVANPLGGVTYKWYDAATNGTQVGTGPTYTTGSLTQTTSFWVTATGANNCESLRNEIQAIIRTPATSEAGDALTACQSASPSAITLSGASVGGGATTGAWSIISGGGTLSSTLQTATPATVTYTPEANFSGTVTLRLTTNNPDGACPSVYDERIITIGASATADAGGPNSACQSANPSAITLSEASVGGGATTGAWSIISGGGLLSSTLQTATPATVTYTPEANFYGTVTLRLTTNDPDGDCIAATADRIITIYRAATADAGGPYTVTCTEPRTVTLNGSFGGGATSGSWSVPAGMGSVTGNVYTPSAAALTAGADVTLTFETNNPDGPCDAASANAIVSFDVCVSEIFCTRTQGYYGNSNGKVCDGRTTVELLQDLLATDLVIGRPGHSFTVNAGNYQCVIDKLPGGGKDKIALASAYTCSNVLVTKQGTLSNGLLAQTLALGLNLRMDPNLASAPLSATLVTLGTTGCGETAVAVAGTEKYFYISSKVLDELEDNYSLTVGGLYELANDALGAAYIPGAGDPSLTDIHNAVDTINNAFDGCRSLVTNRVILSATTSSTLKGVESNHITAYPTPFSDKATIEFTISRTENFVVNLYDMKGALVKQLKAGTAKAGELQVVEVDGKGLGEGLYIARMISDSGARSVKLLLKRE